MSDTWHHFFSIRDKIRSTPIKVENGTVSFYPSPYQIPDAFQVSSYSGGEEIRFRYGADEEGTKKISLSDGVIITVGKNSGRLYGLSIPDELVRAAVEAHLEKISVAVSAIDQLRENPALSRIRPQSYEDNYRITQEILQNRTLSFVP